MIITPDNSAAVVFDAQGLLPAIAQDIDTGEVLMLAWMNAESLRLSLERRRAVFWSRSRESLWEKGETSGHTLELLACHADCDRDTLLLLVRPKGPACHVGTLTCFSDAPLTGAGRLGFLAELEQIVAGRIAAEQQRTLQADAAPPSSYTAKLYAAGPRRLAQKVGEEGLETALAAAAGSDTELVSEASDLLYHLTVCLQARGLSLEKIADELRARHARDRQSKTISTAGDRKL